MESTKKRKQARDIYSRVVAVLKGEKPDRLPFIDRLTLWYTSHSRAGTLPKEFKGMSLTEVHRAVGIGQQQMMRSYSFRLDGVEIIAKLDGETFYHEVGPVVGSSFPRLYGIVQADKPGVTVAEVITPLGKLTMQYKVTPSMIESATVPYMQEPPIKDIPDYRVLEYIVERAEYVPKHETVHEEQAKMGDIGFVVPFLSRIPFQQILLDYVGEIPLFYLLYDNPQLVEKMMALLDQQLVEAIHKLADLPWLYIEFPDNIDGVMTNPKLFKKYCLPYYQRYTEILHGQGKKVGSHTDGNVKPILGLLAESGLDVCEAFTPAPVTECTFEEAWNAWRDGPIIWGGIPSPILEARTSEREFRDYVQRVLETVGDQPIILGVGDMVMGNNLIERVRYIVDRVEEHVIGA